MANQPGQQPSQQKPPLGFYTLMTTVGIGLAVVVVYLIASYFAK